jgi:hypothetical protein
MSDQIIEPANIDARAEPHLDVACPPHLQSQFQSRVPAFSEDLAGTPREDGVTSTGKQTGHNDQQHQQASIGHPRNLSLSNSARFHTPLMPLS